MLCPRCHLSNPFLHGWTRSSSIPLFTSIRFSAPPPRCLLSSSPSLGAASFQIPESHKDGPIPAPEVELQQGESDGDAADSPRKQNARSFAILRSFQSQDCVGIDGEELESIDEEEEKEKIRKKRLLEELALIGKRRSARFPGAIDFPKPGDSVGDLVKDDSRALKQALEIRRSVAAEILKVSIRISKLSMNYSNNLVSRLPDFVDVVLIEAASMKANPEFSHLNFNARARAYIESSGIVPLVKWLKHNSMSYPQIGRMICMCPSNLELLRGTVVWLKSINVKGENLGPVLVKAGPIWERGITELDKIINCLVNNGVGREWIGFIVSRSPKVLTLTLEELEQQVEFYMEMGMSKKDFGTMLFDYPKAIGFFSMEEMKCKVNYLKEFGLSTAEVGLLLAFKPHLIGCSIEDRWKPLVKYLYYLGVRRDGMKRMLMAKPMIFCVDLETTIAPKVRFLQDIGIREEAIGSVLVKFPPLLTYSLYKKIRPVVIFLMTKAGVTEKNIGKVIALEPELVGCSIIHKLELNVKYFLSLGIRVHSLGDMIADFPMLLKYNLDVLRPKYRFLRRIMVRPLQDLIEFPRFVSYSLEGRIIPRHKILVENRINFKLRYMLVGSDQDFEERVKAAVEKRRRFEAGSLPVPTTSAVIETSDFEFEVVTSAPVTSDAHIEA